MASSSDHQRSVLRKYFLTTVLATGCVATIYGLLVRLEVMTPSNLAEVSCLPICDVDKPFHTETTQIGISSIDEQQSVAELIGQDFDPEKVSILVDKSAYRLTVFYDSQPVKAYSTVFGSAPVGDKLAEGDRKTPEGIYRVKDLYPHSDWSKFIWLDYPTAQDWREHNAAKRAGNIALTATIGSEIGIHGVPQGADNLIDSRSNWTWGCVSLKNQDIDEIYEVMSQGTLVEIVP